MDALELRLSELSEAELEVRQQMTDAVRQARAAGKRWARIAEVLGWDKRMVHQRWAGVVD